MTDQQAALVPLWSTLELSQMPITDSSIGRTNYLR